ncbi:MAG: permease [Bacilli bacterium]|jgi:hypothetical protein|nr:permease [Bacilli bacterium]
MIACGNFFIVENKISAIIVLIFFAYLISLCSTSDPFVGKSLLNSFGVVPIISYLLLGPMIDIKNTIVLFGNYKKSFVVALIALIFITIFIVCFVYTALILYIKISNNLGNYLAPQMQKYILWFVPILFSIGLVMCFNNHIHYKFKFSDLILLLPILIATNRNNFYNSSKSKTNNEKTSQSKDSNQDIEITKSICLSMLRY